MFFISFITAMVYPVFGPPLVCFCEGRVEIANLDIAALDTGIQVVPSWGKFLTYVNNLQEMEGNHFRHQSQNTHESGTVLIGDQLHSVPVSPY